MASSPENKMVSFVGNPTLKFFNTVWWLSIGAAHEKSKKRFPRERFESRFYVVPRNQRRKIIELLRNELLNLSSFLLLDDDKTSRCGFRVRCFEHTTRNTNFRSARFQRLIRPLLTPQIRWFWSRRVFASVSLPFPFRQAEFLDDGLLTIGGAFHALLFHATTVFRNPLSLP